MREKLDRQINRSINKVLYIEIDEYTSVYERKREREGELGNLKIGKMGTNGSVDLHN